MLENLVTNKTNVNNANADQISLIINLMEEYDKNDLFNESIKISMKKSKSWKSIESAYNNNTIEISAPIWNDEFDLPDDHILFQTFKILLNILLKNMRLQQIIHPYKFTLKELKIMLYLRLKQAIN